jgi:PAP2 superfamily protein
MVHFFRNWEIASAAFFAYTAIVAVALPTLSSAARRRVETASACGIALAIISTVLPPTVLLHGWLVPPVLLLLGYWTSGALFVAPMPGAERTLQTIDRALGIRPLAAIIPRWAAELLEFAYAGVYALIPISLALHLTLSGSPDADRFWSIVLITDFLCFAALPWIQTRPPRALEPGDPWTSRFRAFNLRLLGAASIHVNTFPSGHAAEALAAALIVSDAPVGVFVWMLFNALAVSAGAVFGRYHYAADAIAGWIVAIVVWLAI